MLATGFGIVVALMQLLLARPEQRKNLLMGLDVRYLCFVCTKNRHYMQVHVSVG